MIRLRLNSIAQRVNSENQSLDVFLRIHGKLRSRIRKLIDAMPRYCEAPNDYRGNFATKSNVVIKHYHFAECGHINKMVWPNGAYKIWQIQRGQQYQRFPVSTNVQITARDSIANTNFIPLLPKIWHDRLVIQSCIMNMYNSFPGIFGQQPPSQI